MGDNGMPPGGVEEYWETPMTLNKTWGFSKFDTMWKSPETVIQRLVEIVSRGGNYLLNIGPKGDGEIPDATVDIFKKVGPWVERNAEAIYGTKANPFGELPWGYATVKDNRVYLFIRDWPKDGNIELPGLNNRVNNAYLLSDRDIKIGINKTDKSTVIRLPDAPSDYPVSVLMLETEGNPSVNPMVVEENKEGDLVLNYLTVNTLGNTMTRFNRKGGFHISKWKGPDDNAEWIINIRRPGNYKVSIDYAANVEWTDKVYEIAIGETTLENKVVHTGAWYDYHLFPLGNVKFDEPGEYRVSIRPKDKSDTYLMYLRSLVLSAVDTPGKGGWGN
jgi:alpha-L-fucosidase